LPGSDGIPAELIQAGGEILRSKKRQQVTKFENIFSVLEFNILFICF
jgi:hypothetical protein